MRRSALFAAVILAAVSTARAQQPAHPDFSGLWVLNKAKSKLTIPSPPTTSTFLIIQRGDHWHLERTHFDGGTIQDTSRLDYVTDNRPITTKDDDDTTVTLMYWKGMSLILDQQITDSDNEHSSNHVAYTLSADKNELTAREVETDPDATFRNLWIFNRVPLPQMKVEWPSTGLSAAALVTLKKQIHRNQGECNPKAAEMAFDYALLSFNAHTPGIIVRSKDACECGATGNCSIFTYRLEAQRSFEMPYFKDETPSGWAYGTTTAPTGTLFLAVGSNAGGGMQTLTFYQWREEKFFNVGSECLRAKDPQESPSGVEWFDPQTTVVETCTAH